MMNTSVPRTLGEPRLDLAAGELDDVRMAELLPEVGGYVANSGCVRPEYNASFLVVTFSMGPRLASSQSAAQCRRRP